MHAELIYFIFGKLFIELWLACLVVIVLSLHVKLFCLVHYIFGPACDAVNNRATSAIVTIL